MLALFVYMCLLRRYHDIASRKGITIGDSITYNNLKNKTLGGHMFGFDFDFTLGNIWGSSN